MFLNHDGFALNPDTRMAQSTRSVHSLAILEGEQSRKCEEAHHSIIEMNKWKWNSWTDLSGSIAQALLVLMSCDCLSGDDYDGLTVNRQHINERNATPHAFVISFHVLYM